jgi:transcriptional regulator with XRE-family HTH domain
MSGMPCGERRKATEFVVDALMYGAAHGYCPTSLAAASVPAADERVTLASLRAAAGLSLRDVKAATANRVSDALLSQYETGKIKRPSATVLIDLAGVYGVPVNTVFEAAEVNPAYVTGESEHRSDALGRPLATLAAAPIPTTSQADVAGEVEVALTREGRYLVGRSRTNEAGGFSVLGDVTDQLRRLGADEAAALRAIVTDYWNAVDIMLDGPDDSDVAMAIAKLTRAQKAARAALAHPSTAGQEDQSRG